MTETGLGPTSAGRQETPRRGANRVRDWQGAEPVEAHHGDPGAQQNTHAFGRLTRDTENPSTA